MRETVSRNLPINLLVTRKNEPKRYCVRLRKKMEQKEVGDIVGDKPQSVTIIIFRDQAMPHHCWWNPNVANISIMSSLAAKVTNKQTPLFYHCHPSQVGLINQFKL